MVKKLEKIIKDTSAREGLKFLASVSSDLYFNLTTVTHELGHYITAHILGKNPRMEISANGSGFTYYYFDTSSKYEDFIIFSGGPLANILGSFYLIYKGVKERKGAYFGFGIAMISSEIDYQLHSLLNSAAGDYNTLGIQTGANVSLIALSLSVFGVFFSAALGEDNRHKKP